MALCRLEDKSSIHPTFAYRKELTIEDNPQLKPSSVLVMRVETFDRVAGVQCVVGWAFYPLFIDKETMVPANDDAKDIVLHNGMY